MRYLVMGAGALGSVFGGLLKHAGQPVAFRGRGHHFEHLRTRGLLINGIWGEYRLGPLAALDGAQEFDVILLCVKSFHTREAAVQVRRHLAPDGLIVSVQNGLGNLEIIAGEFGAARTVGARVIFGARVSHPGAVTVTVSADQVLLGPMAGERPPAQLAQVASELTRAGIKSAVVADILPHLWNKVLYNCALNPLGAILGVPYGALGEDPQTREFMQRLIEEIYQVAQALKVPLLFAEAPDYFRHFLKDLVPPTAAHRPSMWQDLEHGRRTEIDALNGAICRYGGAHGVPTPYNDAVCHLVRFLEHRKHCRAVSGNLKKDNHE